MSIKGVILPGAEFISSLGKQGTISREAKKRLKWIDFKFYLCYKFSGEKERGVRGFIEIDREIAR